MKGCGKRYEDKSGNKVILTRNKSGGFYIKVSYSNDCSGGFGITKQDFEAMKEMDALVSTQENHSQQPRESHEKLNTSCKEETGEKRGAITNGEMESSPAIISQSPVDTLVSKEVIKNE